MKSKISFNPTITNGNIDRKIENEPIFKCECKSKSDVKGIISKLGSEVTLKVGSNETPSCPLSNIRTYDDLFFETNFFNVPQLLENSYILFDFGEKKKI